MEKIELSEKIKNGFLLMDGAMGTQLMSAGIDAVPCNETLNLTVPETVLGIHNKYLGAGSGAVITNTFGANSVALGRHGLADQAEAINTAAAGLARRAAGAARYVLGDIGPSGDFLEPLGTLKAGQLKDVFARQAQALLAGGVDGFILETFMALDEALVAVRAAKSVAGDMPVICSMSFDAAAGGFRTMMGVDVTRAVTELAGMGADAVGFNCGKASLDQYVELAGLFASAVESLNATVSLTAEPNAGMPQTEGGELLYDVSPEDFASAVVKIRRAGFALIGGCCGTTPDHIAAAAKALGAEEAQRHKGTEAQS